MLGEVPISVTSPPSSEAKAIGISRAEGGVPVRRASCKATGMKMASAPIFFVTTEAAMTAATSAGTCVLTLVRCGSSGRIRHSTAPDRATAALTSSAEATMMTMSSLKPVKAASAGTMPVTRPASRASIATRS